MIQSTIIDVVIGLTFVFLLFSFCATALVEALGELRQWKGRLLLGKLEALLGADLVVHFYCERRVADLASGAAPKLRQPTDSTRPGASLVDRLQARWWSLVEGSTVIGRFTSKSIGDARFLAERMGAGRLPAYIPESVFADVMLDWLQGVSLPTALQPGTQNARPLPYDLAELWSRMNRRAGGDQRLLREELVRWFRQAAERTSGEFKRRTRTALYVVGALLVVALNLDAIRMARTLYADPLVRMQLADSGAAFVASCPDGGTSCPEFQRKAREALQRVAQESSSGLIGWNLATPDEATEPGADGGTPLADQAARPPRSWPQRVLPALAMGFGWLLTVLAIGMGADFWFGLLKRVVAIRNAQRVSATDEPLSPAAAAPAETPAPSHGPARAPLDIARPEFARLKGFQPLRFAESNVHAFWLGHFASLAYSQLRELEGSPLLANHELEVRAFDRGGTQAFLFTGEAVAILAFRGTEKTLEDWLTDARVAQVDNPWQAGAGIGVHQGFHAALDQIWEPLRAALAALKTPVWLTGHSLGGALAVLTAYRVFVEPREGMPTIGGVYTFGQPRAGNGDFVRRCPVELAQRIYRYVNASDLVPLVPPPHLGGYDHLGHFRYFDGSGRLHHERTLWERIAERLTPALVKLTDKDADWREELARHARERIENHAMSRYIECLERIDAVRALATRDAGQGIADDHGRRAA
ncbi:lipase family protein [Arenimonas composti]|uniref:Fungal lipase-type domain-containing protein n=1 Tax=Arenimonas composti TR7-09 = DSM 18010 TaxID=1121013 RepID=A0A091BV62_9GAMM|nr:lipase family protein [Arenimonas composti]KFN48230.1 hypothetical protein P873_01350 [Arenimonas composti TR7-09 = DSM 18010]